MQKHNFASVLTLDHIAALQAKLDKLSSRDGHEVPFDARVPSIVNTHSSNERSSTPSCFYSVTNGHDIDDFFEIVDPEKM